MLAVSKSITVRPAMQINLGTVETFRNGALRWTPRGGMPRCTNDRWTLPQAERPIDAREVFCLVELSSNVIALDSAFDGDARQIAAMRAK